MGHGYDVPAGGISNAISSASHNSREAATLAAGAIFQGVGEDVGNYGRVGVSIISDNHTEGILTMETSLDNITWSGPDRTISDTRFTQPHMWNIVERYFRIKYKNGDTQANNLAIQVQYSNNIDIFLGHQLDELLIDEREALLIRAVLAGKDRNGIYQNVDISPDAKLGVQTDRFAHVLECILSELQKMNIHLSLASDQTL